jgi:hypothetical protein
VKKCKVKEEYSREEVHPLYGPDADSSEYLADPNHTQHSKRQEAITPIELNQKEDHPHHHWNKHQVLQHMPHDQPSQRHSHPNPCL